VENDKLQRAKEVWENSLKLAGSDCLFKSGVKELSEFFNMTEREVTGILPQSVEIFAKEWERKNIDIKNENSVNDFYNGTSSEIFELMDWHINKFTTGPLHYVRALEIAKQLDLKAYLDYGSGIGSGAIVFLRNGFSDIACADIAEPLRKFVDYRLKKRNMKASLIDLRTEKLDKARYDLITCFDVLEHTTNPRRILKDLRDALKDGGFLILNNADCGTDEDRPMHISTAKLEKRLRGMGFQQLWNFQNEFKELSPEYVLVLKKIKRHFMHNFLFYLYDGFCPKWLVRIVHKLK